MEDTSPPKRVTRARAAAKTKLPAEPTVKIATAAAKVSRATRTTAVKKKAQIEEKEDEPNQEVAEEMDEIAVDPEPEKSKPIRGRPKKAAPVQLAQEEEIVEEAPVAVPIKATRGRPKKVVEQAPPPAPEPIPVKSTRGRPRKVEVAEEAEVEEVAAPEPPKRVVRSRAAPVTKSTTAPKKTVKFEDTEPDKENIVPTITTKGKGKEVEVAVGFKAKPVRKAAVVPRATRGRAAKTTETESTTTKTPLSPKKATQMSTAKDLGSDDELATMEKTPMKLLMKSPAKSSAALFGTAKKLDFTSSIVVNRMTTSSNTDFTGSLMASPARRPPQSPFRGSMKSPPKRNDMLLGNSMLGSPFKLAVPPPASKASPFKTSLLQSPARRPASPTKVSANGSPAKPSSSASLFGTTPRASTFNASFATPRTLNKGAFRPGRVPMSMVAKPATESRLANSNRLKSDFNAIKPFSGRLSTILPRQSNPVMAEDVNAAEVPLPSETESTDDMQTIDSSVAPVMDDKMEIDVEVPSPADLEILEEVQSTTPTQSPPRNSLGSFGLREQDEDPFHDSDSEDELASDSPRYSATSLSKFNISSKDFASPATPTPAVTATKTPSRVERDEPTTATVSDSRFARAHADQVGFTPLARQLSEWMAASPETSEDDEIEQMQVGSPTPSPGHQVENIIDENTIATDVADVIASDNSSADNFEIADSTAIKSTFFEDEMMIREDPSEEIQETGLEAIDFAPAELDDEDLALAAEADEMSLLEPDDLELENVEDIVDILNDAVSTRALSEASQEYGDENEIPIDPNLLDSEPAQVDEVPATVEILRPTFVSTPYLSTPVRGRTERVFHTVSKVPLKPAAEESPMKFSSHKRSASASKVLSQRPPPAPPASQIQSRKPLESQPTSTPSKSDTWSTDASPTRTPRRDLNDQVLKGAVVFVDVHTTEGADASAVFVELLGQMGAKCVKTWSWNPNANTSSPNGEENGNKIGITHVVFKDGGKRTLEKVRESKGVVLCVGVGWVLDCERTNQWIDEASYSVDTGLVPRGGHRRRKSMEPRRMSNMNGTLTSTPGRAVSAGLSASPMKDFLSVPETPGTITKSNRRASTQWVRSPKCDDGQESDILELSPVPATPAPEAISAYAEHILDGETGEETPYFIRQEDLVQMTAPPKQSENFLKSGPEDEGSSRVLMQRLMLARRKSLQWAPKVGSPLARGASYGL